MISPLDGVDQLPLLVEAVAEQLCRVNSPVDCATSAWLRDGGNLVLRSVRRVKSALPQTSSTGLNKGRANGTATRTEETNVSPAGVSGGRARTEEGAPTPTISLKARTSP